MAITEEHSLTEGNVSKQLIRFAVPFLLSNILQALYNLADVWIVGHYVGSHGLSAVSLGGRFMMVILSIATGMTTAGSVLVAQYYGARKYKRVNKTIGTMFSSFFLFGLVLTVVGFFVAEPLLVLIKTPPEAFNEAVNYLRVSSLGIVFTIGYNAVAAVLRGVGDSKSSLVFVAIAALLNVGLDILFVGKYGWGAGGAAAATVIAQGVAFMCAVIYLRRKDFLFDFKRKSFTIHKEYLKRIVKIGLPSAVQMTLMNTSALFLASLVNGYGVNASAAMAIGQQIDMFAIMPSFAFSNAVSAMSGQNIGAGKIERTKEIVKKGILFSTLVGVGLLIVMWAFTEPMVGVFVENPNPQDSLETMKYAVDYVRINAFSYVILSGMFVFNGLSTGSGYTTFTLINSALSTVVIRVPLAYFLSNQIGINGVFWALSLAPIGSYIAGFIFYKSGRWKESGLLRHGEPDDDDD